MYRYRKKIFIGLFIAALVLPGITYPVAKRWVDTENYENRELAGKPVLGDIPLNEYPDAYENYFNDHLPYKNQLRTAKSAMDVLMFKSLDSDKVLLGKDGWLFYKSEGCLEDYKGLRAYSQPELEEMKNNLLAIQEWFESRGIELVINIVPNKCEVYDCNMPDDIQIVNSISASEQAVNYLNEETDILIFYDLKRLQNAADNYQIYCKYDTHWNYIGGYYGAQTIAEALGKQLPDCTDADIVKWSEDIFAVAPQQAGTMYDLAMMISLPRLLDVDKDPRYMVNYKPDVQFEFASLASYSDVDTMIYTSNAEDKRHLMMIGDSFANLDMPYLAKEFGTCSLICYNHYEENFISERKPDIVVFQIVERRAMRFDQMILNIIENEKE